jgi:regulator of protease activity HflC (stomatin/prohibitin superfamily)
MNRRKIMPVIAVVVALAIFLIVSNSVYVLKEYERGVIFRLGRLGGVKGPGLIFIIPFVDKLERIDQRTVTLDIPTQDVITRDNVSVKVNAVLYFRVMDPSKAIVQVEDYLLATSQLAQTTLRSVCGEAELDDLLAKREEINQRIQEIIDKQTDPWGMKVSLVEIKHIDLPQEMQRAMAKQAEAERERRAKIIQAEGEYQASEKLTAAAMVMSQDKTTIQLRYLETLRDIATENNSTIVFPLPLDMLEALRPLVTSIAQGKK